MKKLLASVCALIPALSLFCAVACDHGNSEPGERISASATNYAAKMEKTQSENGAELMLSKQIGNTVFLQYHIGKIQNCFIQNAMTPIYNDGSLKKITYTENFVTSKTISEGISKSVSTTESVSITDTVGKTLSWKFGAGNSMTASVSAGVNVGIVTAQAGISDTFSLSAEIGGSVETIHSETISKSTTDTVNHSYNVTYIEEQCRTAVSEYNMSDYEKNYYYALGLVADVNIYQIIAYDKTTGDFYTTYFVSDIDNTNIALRMLSSPTASFSVPADVKVSPITEINIDAIVEVDDGNTTDFMGGNGTEENPYYIGNAEQFMNIKMYPNANYRILSDIDMSTVSYLPIREFSGTILGAGRTISNLTYRDESFTNAGYGGLFKTNTGNISDLYLSNCTVTVSPKFNNEDIDVYGGIIAAVNKGTIKNCMIKSSAVIVNSSDIAEKFIKTYHEDPREILQGSENWRNWISQSFYLSTVSWLDTLRMRVYAGGVSGVNYGTIENCTFIGSVEANLYYMLALSDKTEQACLAGGITGLNSGSVISATTTADISAWIELDNDGRGGGWVGDIYPRAICFACGLVGNNVAGALLSGQANGEEKANYRIYAPQYAFGANYNSATKGHKDNLTIGTSNTSCSH